MTISITALYHRPDTKYGYLYDEERVHLRLKTKKDEVTTVLVHHGDPFIFCQSSYQYQTAMKKIGADYWFDYWQVEVVADYNRLQYLFDIQSSDGDRILFGDRGALPYSEENLSFYMNGFKLPYLHQADRCKAPSWVAETIWYQIFPERFAKGPLNSSPQDCLAWDPNRKPGHRDFFGGNLQGVLDKLDYLQELGITGLYFCPIFEAPSNHKYDTADYFSIDPYFGDKKLFKQLVQEAHKRGMKVMLDAVFNHIGSLSPQWQDVLEKGEASPYKDWFHIKKFPLVEKVGKDKILNYHTFAFQGKMPKLNTSHPDVKAYLLEVATYWIQECDIDGWRLDVANEIDHGFWKDFQKAVLAIKPDLYILGEIWHSAHAWLGGDEFHAVMNYPLSQSIKDYFLTKRLSSVTFQSHIYSQLMTYRRQTTEVLFNLLDSHDTERILTTAKGNKDAVKAALTFLFLQLGTPCIYYGTEVGMLGGEDPDCRRVMPWEADQQDQELLTFMKQLIRLRKKQQDCIQKGEFRLDVLEAGVVLLSYHYHGRRLEAYFNQTNQTFFLEKVEQVLLSNLCQLDKERLSLLPQGIVVVSREETYRSAS